MERLYYSDTIFYPHEYEQEKEFENQIITHAKDIFGSHSVYIDIKKKIGDEIASIPDGYLIDFYFEKTPRLHIIEIELSSHDPYRHIGQKMLKFAISYKASGRKIKRFLLDNIMGDTGKKSFVEDKLVKAGYRNIDDLLENLIFEKEVSAIVVIDECTEALENVLGQLTMKTDIIEFKTYKHEDEVIHKYTPFQEDIADLSDPDTNPEDLDTIVVPANPEGFNETFLGENCWYAIRISSNMINRIKYIAGYQTAPISAITHYAKVANIEKYKDTGKYIVYFKEGAKEIGPLKFSGQKQGTLRSARYTTFDKLMRARNFDGVF